MTVLRLYMTLNANRRFCYNKQDSITVWRYRRVAIYGVSICEIRRIFLKKLIILVIDKTPCTALNCTPCITVTICAKKLQVRPKTQKIGEVVLSISPLKSSEVVQFVFIVVHKE